MSKGLFDYIASNPAQEPPQEQESIKDTARTYRERKEQQEQAAKLKDSIDYQLNTGAAPQNVLYTALQAIGLLSNDIEWAQDQQGKLDKVYEDLAQQSFITDNEQTAAHRLQEMQQEYNDRLKRQLTNSLNKYRHIEKSLTEALKQLNDMEPEEDILT